MSELTPQGLVIDRLNQIIAAMQNKAKVAFGDDINTDPDSVFTQLFGILGEILESLNEGLLGVYQAFYPDSAEGASLDNVCSLVGVRRLAATTTQVDAVVTGNLNTVIPADAQASILDTGQKFTALDAVTLTLYDPVDVLIAVGEIQDNTRYQIVINGTDFNFTSGINTTAQQITAGLVAAITAGLEPVAAIDLDNGTFRVEARDFITPFRTNLSLNLVAQKLSALQTYLAVNTGPVLAPPNTLTQIQTPIFGWDSITNPYEGELGRDRETDTALRIRRSNSLQIAGVATLDSIRSRVGQLPGVLAVLARENVDLVIDENGLPGKSFEIIVEGGDTQAIAQKIWDTKPAGIESFGNVTVEVQDQTGFPHFIRFSRPTLIYLWIKVTFTQFSEEEFPPDGIQAIAQTVLKTGQAADIGMDVIPQRSIGPIYMEVPGISHLIIEMATSFNPDGPPGPYTQGLIVIDIDEVANFDLARIQVEEAP